MSQDQIGINEVLSGEDFHALNQQAFNLPSRLIAKIYLFRTIYRGSGFAFANDPAFMHVSKSPHFWDELNEKFYAKYHGIDSTHKHWAELVARGEPIIGPFGRGWKLPNINKHGNFDIPWTTLTNFPVQGTGADIMVIARVSLARRLKQKGWPVKLILTVHDSIVVDAPDEYVQPVTDLMYQVFDDLPMNINRLFHFDWNVPMGCEVKVGKNLKDMEKLQRKDLQ